MSGRHHQCRNFNISQNFPKNLHRGGDRIIIQQGNPVGESTMSQRCQSASTYRESSSNISKNCFPPWFPMNCTEASSEASLLTSYLKTLFGLAWFLLLFFPFYSKIAEVSLHFLPPSLACFSPWHLEPSMSHMTSYLCLMSETSLEGSRKTRVPFRVHCYILSTEAPTWHIQGHPVNLSP